MYWIEYTITSERRKYEVKLELEKEPEYYDTLEGIQILRRKISSIENIAIDSFSIGNITRA